MDNNNNDGFFTDTPLARQFDADENSSEKNEYDEKAGLTSEEQSNITANDKRIGLSKFLKGTAIGLIICGVIGSIAWASNMDSCIIFLIGAISSFISCLPLYALGEIVAILTESAESAKASENCLQKISENMDK